MAFTLDVYSHVLPQADEQAAMRIERWCGHELTGGGEPGSGECLAQEDTRVPVDDAMVAFDVAYLAVEGAVLRHQFVREEVDRLEALAGCLGLGQPHEQATDPLPWKLGRTATLSRQKPFSVLRQDDDADHCVA